MLEDDPAVRRFVKPELGPAGQVLDQGVVDEQLAAGTDVDGRGRGSRGAHGERDRKDQKSGHGRGSDRGLLGASDRREGRRAR